MGAADVSAFVVTIVKFVSTSAGSLKSTAAGASAESEKVAQVARRRVRSLVIRISAQPPARDGNVKVAMLPRRFDHHDVRTGSR